MSKRTVEVLFKIPSDGPNRSQALLWAKTYGSNFLLSLQECPRGDWFIWMMTRSKVKPKPLVRITHQCIASAMSELSDYGDVPFERGFHIVERWLDGEATLDDCQDSFDDLSGVIEVEELLPNNPLNIANHITSHLLTAIVDISEGSSKSDLAYSLAWAVYLAAKLQSVTNKESLEQVLMHYANFLRQSLNNSPDRI